MTFDPQPGFSVGVERLDVEHRQLVRRARQLEAAAEAGRVDEVRSALRFLHGYLAEHCAAEEEWMASAGYPGVAEHGRRHRQLLERFAAAAALDGKGAGRLAAAAAEAARALDEHLETDDVKLARFFTARENLRLLAEAGPGVGASLTPLPGVLRAVTPVPGAAPAAPAPGGERPSLTPAPRAGRTPGGDER